MGDKTSGRKLEQGLSEPHNKTALFVPIVICALLFLTSVMAIFTNLVVFDGKRILQVGLMPLIFLFALIHPLLRRTTAQLISQTPTTIKVVLLAFFLLGFVSSVRLQHPGYSLVDVSMLFCSILLVYVVAASRIIAQTNFDKLIMGVLIAITIVVSLQELMGLLANMALGIEFAYESMFIYFSHARFYNQFQTWTIPLLAAIPFVFKAHRGVILLTLLLLGFQWYLLFVSGARGSIVSLTSALVLISVVFRSHGKHLIKLQVGGAVLGMLFYYLVSMLQKAPGATQFIAQSIGRDMSSSTGRYNFLLYAWNDALANPWLGAGPGRFACNALIDLPAHPHNFAMQLLSEWGFPATVLILGLAIYMAIKLVRSVFALAKGDDRIAVLGLSLFTSLLAAVIHSSVSGILVMPASMMVGVLVCGWLLAVFSSNHGSVGVLSVGVPKGWYAILAAGLLVSIQMFSFSLIEIQNSNQRFENFSPTDRQMPRFWNRGRICRYNYNDTHSAK